MPPTRICIVARLMSRTADRATRTLVLLTAIFVAIPTLGCDKLDGRNRNRKGNRLFHETQFADAAAEYELALPEVNDPVIHYNLGVAYSKVFKPGSDKPVLLGKPGETLCSAIPKTKVVDARVCVKEGDRHYADCDDKNVCPSSFACEATKFCALDSPVLADMAADHFQIWIKTQLPDDEIKVRLKAASAALADAQASTNNAAISLLKKQIDDLRLKDDTRRLMTQLWLDSDQYPKALAYWEGLLKDKPNDADIMGNLAGINLKAGDWRKSIEWYLKVADIATDTSAKVAALQFIGNVAWSKLNSKTLPGPDSVELADRGIGALQKASELQPENPKPLGLMASIFNFRGVAQGASWAAAFDRASAQELQHASRVLNEKAKKAAGQPAPAVPVAPAATNPNPPKTGG